MEMSIRQFQEQIAEALAAVERGERVVITRDGVAVAVVKAAEKLPRATPEQVAAWWEQNEEARRAAGLDKKTPPFPLDEEWRKSFDDPAFSRAVLGLSDDWEPWRP